MRNRKILVSLTTLSNISKKNLSSGWESKIEEIKENNLEEIALFLTGLKKEERKKLYNALENTAVKSIPHVHLRTDMELKELDYLVQKYSVQAFNLHATAEWPLIYDYDKYASKIFFENIKTVPVEEELKKFGGLCVDFSHWKEKELHGDVKYCEEIKDRIKKYKIGCSHVSAIKDEPIPIIIDPYREEYSSHILENLSELDYIKEYKKYLPDLISIELENSITEQLEAKKYLEKLINAPQ
ncbi:MAG: hypothetical protein PHP25_05535 [Candidatus Moranbacteria bacterium]|nr:hypothetical protein [Candidatus Moranbacteria bacterium]